MFESRPRDQKSLEDLRAYKEYKRDRNYDSAQVFLAAIRRLPVGANHIRPVNDSQSAQLDEWCALPADEQTSAQHTAYNAYASKPSFDAAQKFLTLIDAKPDNAPTQKQKDIIEKWADKPSNGIVWTNAQYWAYLAYQEDPTMNAALALISIIDEKPVPKKPATAPTGALEQAIAALVDDRIGAIEQAQVDESQIIELIEKHSKAPAVTHITVTRPDDSVIDITGAHYMLPSVLRAVRASNCYMVGGAGSGKTTLAASVAEALGLDLYTTGAVLQKYELVGHVDATSNYHRTAFRDAFEYGGVFLLDEGDACSAEALVAINGATANGSYTFPDQTKPVKKHVDFHCIVAANTIGLGATRQYSGREPLDGATLDRFIQREIGYDSAIELSQAEAEYAKHGGAIADGVAAAWCLEVQTARVKAAKLGLTVIISPRQSMQGAALLALGDTIDEVRESTLYKHLSADQRAQMGVS